MRWSRASQPNNNVNMADLKKLVRDKISAIGVEASSKLFGVSVGTASNWGTGKTVPSVDAVEKVLDLQEVPILESGSLPPSALFADSSTQNPVVAIETKSQVVTWEGKKVMMLLPVYRTVNPHTHFTLFANYARYGAEKIALAVKDRTVIHESRNELIHIGMQNSEIETFIFCDDDMILPCGSEQIFNGNYRAGVKPESARFNAISRLMSHGRDKEIVGALYYGRHEFGMPQCEFGFSEHSAVRAKELRLESMSGLQPQTWVGTGLMKIERTAIEKYKSAIDAGQFPGLEPLPGRWYGYFTPLRSGVGEDVSFCHRLNKIGVQAYVDTSLVCLHSDGGSTHYGPHNTRNP